MIDFIRPWVLLGLPLPLIAWWLLPAAVPNARLRASESVLVLMRGMHGRRGHRTRNLWPTVLLAGGWIALMLALAGPVTKLGDLVRPSGHDIVIAIDLSASMGRASGSGDATAFERYRSSVSDLFERLAPGDRVALIAFGEQAYLIAPLTHDTGALDGYLDELTVGMPGRKTSLGVAIGLALKTFSNDASSQNTLLILSDGEDNAGELPAPDAAQLAQERGVQIHSVGLATAETGGGGDVLRQVAEITGGSFSVLPKDGVLPTLTGTANGAANVAPTTTPLRRLWTSELLLLAAFFLAAHMMLFRRST